MKIRSVLSVYRISSSQSHVLCASNISDKNAEAQFPVEHPEEQR